MDSEDRASKSCVIQHTSSCTTLVETSVDLMKEYVSNSSSYSDNSKRCLTSISDSRIKPLVLITDNPTGLVSIIKKTKYTSIVPFIGRSMMRPHLKGFLEDLMKKTLYLCFNKQSLENVEYIAFIQQLIKERQNEFGKDNGLAAKVLPLRAFLLNGLTSLPSELKEIYSISINQNTTVDDIAKLLEGPLGDPQKNVENILEETDFAPRQLIIFKLKSHFDEHAYMKKSWNSLLETFEDAGSFPRQHFLQLLHIPNVETLRSRSSLERLEVCIEIQPNNVEDYLHFLRLYQSCQFRIMVQNSLKVNSESFIGSIYTSINNDDILRVVKYFCPNLIKQQELALKQLIAGNKLEELVELIGKSTTGGVKEEGRVHSLTAMCATMIYQAFLKRSDLSPFQYLRYMKKLGWPDFLTHIRTSTGYNALHLAVKEENEDYLKMLFYANKWSFLRKDVVTPLNVTQESQHVGYVPRRLAEALSYKDTGLEIMKSFDEYDRYIRYMPPLHKACLMGSTVFASTLITVDPYLMEVKDEFHANCLLYACASGNSKLVNMLLQKGVPRNVQNRIGDTALHTAAMFGHLDVLNVLSSYFFEIRGKENKFGFNALYYAVRFGDIDVIKLYKGKGFKIDAKALTIAAKYQQNDVFDFVFEEVCNVNRGEDKEGRLALHYAVINGNASMVEKLLKEKADITLVDKYKNNVLHLAAKHGRKYITEIIIDQAVKVNCLEQLISGKNVFTGEDLLVVIRGKDCGRKAWHWVELKRLYIKAFNKAMKSGQVDVVRFGQILKSGFGTYPDKECKIMMKKRLSDIFNEQKGDMTPLHVAAMQDDTDLVKILLKYGALPNDLDSKGATAMHYGAMNNNIRIMHLLHTSGGSLDAKTADGQTPFDIAKDTGNTVTVNFFQASEPIEMAKNFRSILALFTNDIHLDTLQRLRNEGKDIKMYIIDQLRDVIIDINHVLMDLGSGPVQEVSEP